MYQGIVRATYLFAVGGATTAAMSCSLLMESPDVKEASNGKSGNAGDDNGGHSGGRATGGRIGTTAAGAGGTSTFSRGGADNAAAGAATTSGGIVGVGGGSAPASGGRSQSTSDATGGLIATIAGSLGFGGLNNTSGGASTNAGNASVAGKTASAGASSTAGSTGIGGSVATAGTSGCGDTQSSADNCGACGHSCLGGGCIQGLCQPAVVVRQDTTTAGLDLIAIDDTHVYYSQGSGTSAPSRQVYRVEKGASSGTGVTLMPVACVVFYGITPTRIHYSLFPCTEAPDMSQPVNIYTCNKSDCSSETNSNGTPRLVRSRTMTTYMATIDRACEATLCVTWWNSAGQITSVYRDSSWMEPIVLHGQGFLDSIAYDNSVFWVQETYDSSHTLIGYGLMSVDNVSLSRAQLAGQFADSVRLVDANPQSVLLNDKTTNALYRVPLPLGVGSTPPLPLGVAGIAATEDASSIYWLDQNGTISRCSAQDCRNTQKVVANAQANGLGLIGDQKALYWGRTNPPSIMRLAK